MKPGDIMRIKVAGDQPHWVRMHAGKLCLIIKNLTQEDGVTSTTNAWDVLLEGRILRVHKLDLESIDKND